MKIKKIFKRIFAKNLKRRIDSHKVTESKMTILKAEEILGKVYTKQSYEMNGRVCEKENYELSLIIPVYNSEKYLEECIESLISQDTKRKYELIFINDGSTDNSLDILKKYESLENVVIISQENQGIANTRNKGIAISRGMYIGFVDNDDKVSKEYVEKLLSAANKNEADIVKCGCIEFDSETGKQLHDFGKHEDFSYDRELGEDLFKFDGFIWGGCYKKSFWNDIQFPDGYWYEDMITRFLLYRQAKSFQYIGNTLYYKREHGNNSAKKIWVSKDVKSLDQLYLVKELIRLCGEKGMKKDKVLFKLIVSEYGFMLGHRTADLDDKIREAAFVLAAHEVSLFPEEYDEHINPFETSLRNRDYDLWKMLSKFRELTY